ncbi:MAG: hypothetical protein IKY23_07445 [Lachnospiraceae bacterium]|nr:hypothetical protein [Lachnospiraceae bacterium]
MNKKTVTIRRVGTVTFGLTLVTTGALFLANIFFPAFDYRMIYRFWPLILIVLGVEVLCGSRHHNVEVFDAEGNIVEQSRVIYDVPGIILMMVLTGFAMCMAVISWAWNTELLSF